MGQWQKPAFCQWPADLATVDVDNGVSAFRIGQLRPIAEHALCLGLQMGDGVVLLRGIGLGIVKVGIPQRITLTVVDGIFLDKVPALAR